ncbi:Rab3 GTPase-activating protein catalytic subunit [Myotis davidii]|uniref:Rab3 GTPase-activating protein catalytic subunit n=1 Tax=Myotis davidii TaxID=225400 RepID=L5LMG3_MYODS|nr:Rab3 GTPase-activating protein catalytic subunit [Myotis davidii]
MAADSEPESEVFELTDFTTASEWERFISRVEEILNDWKLIGNSLGKPLEKARCVKFMHSEAGSLSLACTLLQFGILGDVQLS